MENWSEVPQELLGLIAESITSIEDYARFGGVCRSWQSEVSRKRQLNISPKTLPWLMFPFFKENEDDECVDCDNDNDTESRYFFSLSEKKFNKLKMQMDVPYGCWGSPYGWLVMFCNKQLELIDPLSGRRLSLPTTYMTDEYWHVGIRKVVLVIPSSNSITQPEQNEFLVLLIAHYPAIFRSQNGTWSIIEDEFDSIFEDIIHLNNQCYVVYGDGFVRCFDIASPSPVVSEFMSPPKDMGNKYLDLYLVEVLGELHMIVKYDCLEEFTERLHFDTDSRPFDKGQMYYFKVFKLDICAKEWERVFTLGDYAIFVGDNTSFSVVVSDYPECKSSCIYFTDHWTAHLNGVLGSGNIGIFSLETEALETLFTGNDILSLCSNPTWFIPKLLLPGPECDSQWQSIFRCDFLTVKPMFWLREWSQQYCGERPLLTI